MITRVIGIYCVWLVIINLFAFYALNRLNLNPDTAYIWINPQASYQNKNLNLPDLRVHWDSFWYLKVAQEGYEYIPGKLSSIAFFPLYPGLIWLVASLPLMTPSLSGWVISTIILGVGLVFLYKLVRDFHPLIDPVQPIILLLIFPTAFFLNSVYTEALFLTLSIACFYYLFKKQFFISAIILTLASLCRLNGLFLLVPFVYEYFKTYGIKKSLNINIFSLAVAPLGIVGFVLYQYLRFGEPLAMVRAQMEWGRRFVFNTEHFRLDSLPAYANLATDLLFFALAVIAGILLVKYIKTSYGLYVLTTALVAAASGTLMSVGRFALILFPLFILVASVKNKYFVFVWQLVSILLLAIYTTLFVNNYWAG